MAATELPIKSAFFIERYGDITPKSKTLKLISCVVAFIMIIEMVSLFVK